MGNPPANRADGRVLRVIKCLRLLERECYSADDLARYFCVSTRTIYRDLRLLTRAGIPLARRAGDRRYHVAPWWPARRSAAAAAHGDPSWTSADSTAS